MRVQNCPANWRRCQSPFPACDRAPFTQMGLGEPDFYKRNLNAHNFWLSQRWKTYIFMHENQMKNWLLWPQIVLKDDMSGCKRSIGLKNLKITKHM